jgi:hypothetical protein
VHEFGKEDFRRGRLPPSISQTGAASPRCQQELAVVQKAAVLGNTNALTNVSISAVTRAAQHRRPPTQNVKTPKAGWRHPGRAGEVVLKHRARAHQPVELNLRGQIQHANTVTTAKIQNQRSRKSMQGSTAAPISTAAG